MSLPTPPVWWTRQPSTYVDSCGGAAYRSRDGGLAVLVSEDEVDGQPWLHVSVSRRSRTPSYEDMARVKADFVGEDRPAYHVFPKASEHRDFHPNCLHLWAPLGVDPFPDPLGQRADAVAPAGWKWVRP